MSQVSNGDSGFISWAQRHTCLLCKYPLALHKHFHHVIARDDGGPDHYLNLVALCPNHHWLVERIKRHIIPGTQSDHWLKTGTAALELYNELDGRTRRIFDVLSKPHKLSSVLRGRVREDLLERAERELMMEDARLLDDVNKERPRIFLPRTFSGCLDSTVDSHAEKMASQAGLNFYSEIITAHMVNLRLR